MGKNKKSEKKKEGPAVVIALSASNNLEISKTRSVDSSLRTAKNNISNQKNEDPDTQPPAQQHLDEVLQADEIHDEVSLREIMKDIKLKRSSTRKNRDLDQNIVAGRLQKSKGTTNASLPSIESISEIKDRKGTEVYASCGSTSMVSENAETKKRNKRCKVSEGTTIGSFQSTKMIPEMKDTKDTEVYASENCGTTAKVAENNSEGTATLRKTKKRTKRRNGFDNSGAVPEVKNLNELDIESSFRFPKKARSRKNREVNMDRSNHNHHSEEPGNMITSCTTLTRTNALSTETNIGKRRKGTETNVATDEKRILRTYQRKKRKQVSSPASCVLAGKQEASSSSLQVEENHSTREVSGHKFLLETTDSPGKNLEKLKEVDLTDDKEKASEDASFRDPTSKQQEHIVESCACGEENLVMEDPSLIDDHLTAKEIRAPSEGKVDVPLRDLQIKEKTSPFEVLSDKEINHLDTPTTSPVQAPASCTQRKLLVLDLNGLIADIVSDVPYGYRPDTEIAAKALFKRPFCDDFLKFCFDRFNVGVWSSRNERNVASVVNYLMRDLKQNLLFCWDQSHCTYTGFTTVENTAKPLVLKELKKLWDKHDRNLPWEKGFYNESNTLLLDDSPYKALLNPPHTAVFPYPYTYRNKGDKSLGPGGDLRVYLEGLAMAEDVQKYVEQHPFGQRAISETNPSRHFYDRVIRSVKGTYRRH